MVHTGGKSSILYHGSSNRNITEFEPRAWKKRDPDEGPLIFASPEFSIASCFISDVAAHCGSFGNIPFYVAETNVFLKNDKGGAVYSLPSDTFEFDHAKGMGMLEWVSNKKVIPVNKKEYITALEAMIESGVQVFLVNEDIFSQIGKASDHGFSILKGLTSENKKRNSNIRFLTEE